MLSVCLGELACTLFSAAEGMRVYVVAVFPLFRGNPMLVWSISHCVTENDGIHPNSNGPMFLRRIKGGDRAFDGEQLSFLGPQVKFRVLSRYRESIRRKVRHHGNHR